MSIETRLKNLYEPIVYPEGNTHQPEWEGRYLGVSTLVKKTAEQYAQRILQQASEDRDPTDAYWGFLGNSLCDAALAPVTPFREVQFCVDLSDDWQLVGHADGVTVIDGKVIVNEGKAYGTIDQDDKNDLAIRQASLYLAMFDTQLAVARSQGANALTFPVASFATDDSIEVLAARTDLEAWGVCLHVFPRFGPPALVQPVEVPAATRAQVLDFYTRKAEAILASVRAGNLDAAREWDRSPEGLTEFTRHHPTIYEGPNPDAIQAHALAKHAADAAIKEAEATKAASQAEVLAAMSEAGVDSWQLPDGTVIKAVGGWDGARRPWLRVTPPKEVEA